LDQRGDGRVQSAIVIIFRRRSRPISKQEYLHKETKMKFTFQIRLLAVVAGTCIASLSASSQSEKPHPFTIPLNCTSGDCPLLKGVPQTAGMRSGFVRLQPGETVGWHTTGMKEESLIILHGQGDALIDGQEKRSFVASAFVYISPSTRHNILNTGKEPLEYVYVVAPIKKQ
jgi:mannose-6-phosphate isomerase-like protein (cupin superfamily)